MKNSKHIVAFCAAGMFAIGMYFVLKIFHHDDNNGYLIPCACDDKRRYDEHNTSGGGTAIDIAEGCRLSNAFLDKNKVNRGAFISKKVIDTIFCSNPEFNGLQLYFALRNDSTYSIMVEGWRDPHVLVDYPDHIPARLFIADTYCPVCCGSLNELICTPGY